MFGFKDKNKKFRPINNYHNSAISMSDLGRNGVPVTKFPSQQQFMKRFMYNYLKRAWNGMPEKSRGTLLIGTNINENKKWDEFSEGEKTRLVNNTVTIMKRIDSL